jgi:hypothetical protein
MKKLFMAAVLFGGLVGSTAVLLSNAPSPGVNVPCVTSTYYNTSTTSPIAYGKADTVNGAVTDTFKIASSCSPKSITFTNDFYKVAGSPTLTVACYASANGGASYGTTAIATFTASPTSLTVPVTQTFVVNNPYGGNPYTNYMWVATGAASNTGSWKGSVMVR